MVTTWLAQLLERADALSYFVKSEYPQIRLVDLLVPGWVQDFTQSDTYEGNVRAALTWCEQYGKSVT